VFFFLQLGCGLVTLDYLATVDAYPRPDDKIRSGELQVSGGGNAGNALTGAARLGLNTRLISKVANDEIGGTVLSELKEAGIDISHVIVRLGLQIYNFCIFVHQALQCK
jgi:sugar/nucleoside kinase (ribokinase family)